MGRWSKRNKKNTLTADSQKTLNRMFEHGKNRSRHKDKIEGCDKEYIYSERTFRTYQREARHFVEWLLIAHPETLHLKQARHFINEYLQTLINEGKSAYTISTRKAALAKLFQTDCSEFIETPGRYRRNITRSRLDTEYDRHISDKKERYYAAFTSAMGGRRAEMERVRGTDLVYLDERQEIYYDKQGNQKVLTMPAGYYVHFTRGTKGGKPRYALIIGEDEKETERIVRMFKEAGSFPVFGKLPAAYDNHHYRAQYAKRAYQKFARTEIPQEDRYIMRKERAGEVLDKAAMAAVSKFMGHNRLDVIAGHYLYG